ncbi:helix-turn-helix domain-containing protein [Vibrio sp. SS-MA-C1-2]|uniref:winged helix-turn-helix domain-containing protein n=1 Tax=Vibrio sp. SS-MA-C1-2 TaxID=2908646 RepID=UPI001F2F0F0D|nr:helix-turn-helix domain-containing protein [Vibrio sp. SS-MA-C1-2]UJF18796.1 helix-turn-helix domain-containing protein [Vibrio sp. SS-MA-C1-2]
MMSEIIQLDCDKNIHCLSCPVYCNKNGVHLNDNFFNSIRMSSNAMRACCLFETNINSVLPYDDIVQHVWNTKYIGASSLPVLINEVRKVFKEKEMKILNVRGVGYILINKK